MAYLLGEGNRRGPWGAHQQGAYGALGLERQKPPASQSQPEPHGRPRGRERGGWGFPRGSKGKPLGAPRQGARGARASQRAPKEHFSPDPSCPWCRKGISQRMEALVCHCADAASRKPLQPTAKQIVCRCADAFTSTPINRAAKPSMMYCHGP